MMAATSAALTQNSIEIPSGGFTSLVSSSSAPGHLPLHSDIGASKTLRGLNKPKCIKCGNVARSRCPFQSCKNCCAKAQNPCHIHVLKGGTNIPDKIPSIGFQKPDPLATDVTHSTNPHRVSSLRQLSSNFSQFNNLQTPARPKKALTKQDAQLINEWRFKKLKEFRDRNIEAENEAFDRYMQNVSLLEEVFSVNESSAADSIQSVDDSTDAVIASLKAKLRSDPVRKENMRKRMQFIVDQGLKAFANFKSSSNYGDVEEDPDETGRRPKRMKSEPAEKSSLLNELIDKVNKARNEDDLKACYDLKAQLSSQSVMTTTGESVIAKANDEQATQNNDLSAAPQSSYSPKKWFKKVTIDQESLNQIDTWFSSVEDVEEL